MKKGDEGEQVQGQEEKPKKPHHREPRKEKYEWNKESITLETEIPPLPKGSERLPKPDFDEY